MATELRKLGARVDEATDAITIEPPATLKTARIATYGDHRMAMCCSLVALAGIAITIEDPDCVNKTFPDYFESFAALSRRTL
jgi:3-phosphoshikimate 1-carboxyvinyltransferase